MILDKTVEIKLNKRLIEKYGYNGESGQNITIDVSELPIHSTKEINVECDICGTKRKLEYRLYMKNYNKYNVYTCEKCCDFKKKNTKLERYGDENYNNKDKTKETCFKKYGTKHHLQNSEIYNKLKDTCVDKYGVDNVNKLDYIRDKITETKKERYGENFEKITEKIVKTKKERYGDENYTNQEKIIETNNNRYNCDFPLQNKDIYNKTVDSFFEKFGCYPTQDKNIREKQSVSLKKTTFNKIKNKYNDLEFISKNDGIYRIKCKNCKNEFEINFNLFHLRLSNDVTLCTVCNDPKNTHTSDFQNQIKNFLEENLIEVSVNDRKILNGTELDIYLKKHNLAIECNGVYWHSELFKKKEYHIEKTKKCNEKGIELIHIWEDDWKNKKDIIKSIILNKLNKTKNKIYARKCEFLEIKNNLIIKNFLNKNHIQGYSKSSIKYGLFYNGELVSIMTFGERKINGKKEFELIRFCNKLNTNVVGSANKLFKNFLKVKKNVKIFSYSDNSIFNGEIYKKMGFTLEKETSLNYFWVVNNKREHRFKFNKKKLVKIGFDENKTEKEIMYENGFYRVWSCGMKKWRYDN